MWTGLKVVRKPSILYKKVAPYNSCTVSINGRLFVITSTELYDQLLQCRSDEQRIATITAWRLIHAQT